MPLFSLLPPTDDPGLSSVPICQLNFIDFDLMPDDPVDVYFAATGYIDPGCLSPVPSAADVDSAVLSDSECLLFIMYFSSQSCIA